MREDNISMPETVAEPTSAAAPFKKFAIAAAVLTALFALPLWKLFRFALGDDLHSYIPLMPFVCVYLAWTEKSTIPRASTPAYGMVIWFVLAAVVALGGYFALPPGASLENQLALSTLAWVLFLTAAGCWTLGAARMRALAFPFFLLIFLLPFPTPVRLGIETMLQHGSAMVADWLFTLTGTPVMRRGMQFFLPGISLEVAPECSGIHSTLVLFITSMVASKMILRRPWTRAVLCLAVIPLALLRNGFRVFVIGELCVHVGPHMIDSPIHHHGGPLFFALSLVPLFLLLYFLKKSEMKKSEQSR